MQAAGLEKKDTFYKSESRETDWRRYLEKREHRKIEAVYNYVSSVTGSYVFTKIRLEGKKILYGILENNRFFYGLRGQSRKELKAVYGSLEAIRKAIKEGEPIFIPEGEKDCDTLKKRGYTAFTYGGANDWQSDFAELLKDANTIILADNDEPGKAVAKRIYDDLKGIARSRKVIVPMPDTPKADITDYFEAGHSKEEFEALINGTTLQKKRMKLSAMSPDDVLKCLDSDKAVQSLTGSWIIELAELKSLARTAGGVESVKRFLSATQDKYRVPYERRADTFYRQCVFAGTTNRADFLQDETGNRRFLIVQIGINEPSKSLFDSTAMDEIKQAWAEAVYIWNNEKPILVLPESCKKEAEELQQENMADDGLAGIIEEYLKDKDRICARQIWHDALKESAEPPKWKVSNINSIIEKIPGWKRLRSPARFAEYGMQRGFEKMSTNKSDFVRVSDEELKEMPFE